MSYKVTPSKITDMLYAETVHDVSRGALNSQPSIVEEDGRDWVETPRNYDIVFENGSTPEEVQRNLRISGLMHDTFNYLLASGYEAGIADNPEGLELIIDRVLQAEHTDEYLNMKSREIKDFHELDMEELSDLEVWGRELDEAKRRIAGNMPEVHHRVNGDSLKPETESYFTREIQDLEYSTMADIELYGDERQVVETKLTWSDSEIPRKEDIFQARLTARISGSRKAYLVYGIENKVYEFPPLRDEEMELVKQKIEPLLDEINSIAGWNEAEGLEPELSDPLREKVEEKVSEWYRKEVTSNTETFDHNQSGLEAF